jgi:hypothetical protein
MKTHIVIWKIAGLLVKSDANQRRSLNNSPDLSLLDSTKGATISATASATQREA